MSAPPARTLADLDGDVLAHCAGYLGVRDIASLAMACRPLRAAAYCDAVWYRLFRDQWSFQQVPHGALGLRALYIRRHTEVNQMRFNDPASTIYYPNPTETAPSHLMLDRNSIWSCQGPVARKLSVGWPEDGVMETHRSHGVRITCMRVSRCYKGHSGPVTSLADKLLVDGEFKVLASGGEDCTVRLWSMSRAKKHPLIATFHGHEKTVSFLSVAWHKSSLLVSSSRDSKVKVWDTVAPSSGSSCVGSTHLNSSGPPIAMKCHESLCYMATGSEVTAIDLRTMKKATVLALRNHRILSCEMLPSEWLICTGTKDKALLWDIRKSQELSNIVAELHSDSPVTLLHLDPYKVVTGVPSDGQVHVWETRTGDLLNTLCCGDPPKWGGRSTLSAIAVDGCRIAMAGSSADVSFLHYRDFLKSSVPVSLPGKEVSRFWRPREDDDSDDEDYYQLLECIHPVVSSLSTHSL